MILLDTETNVDILLHVDIYVYFVFWAGGLYLFNTFLYCIEHPKALESLLS